MLLFFFFNLLCLFVWAFCLFVVGFLGFFLEVEGLEESL